MAAIVDILIFIAGMAVGEFYARKVDKIRRDQINEYRERYDRERGRR